MWQAPNQRTRALANQKKRERDKQRRPVHIRRIRAELKVVGGLSASAPVTEVRLLLNDLSPKGLGLFASSPMMVGQMVALTMEEPRQFFVRGRVIWCKEVNAESHIMSAKSFNYRMGIEFVFDSPEEEKQVAAYCAEIARTCLYTVKPAF